MKSSECAAVLAGKSQSAKQEGSRPDRIRQPPPLDSTSVPNHVLTQMLLSAFRYALGRRTYIVAETRAWMEAYWRHLKPWHRQIHDDIRWAIKSDDTGLACDQNEWRKVLALPIGEGEE